MDWYVVDKEYIDELTKVDNKVGYVEYGERLKLHVGILIQVNGYNYYVPISSPKPKHYKMANNLDFHKLIGEADDFLYAVVNLNNMIPVPNNCVTQLKYNNIEAFRRFSSEKEKNDYIYLLQIEKQIIDSIEAALQKKAEKLYHKCINNPDSFLAKRCCDFKKLENVCNMDKWTT